MRNIFQKTIWAIVVVFGIATNDAKAEIDNPQNAKAGEIYRWETNNPNYYDQLCEPDNGVYRVNTYAIDQADWDSQFFIVIANERLDAGQKIRVRFRYKKEGGTVIFYSSGHADPHEFVNNDGWLPKEATDEWQVFDTTFIVSGAIRTLAVNASCGRDNGTLLFRNIIIEVDGEIFVNTTPIFIDDNNSSSYEIINNNEVELYSFSNITTTSFVPTTIKIDGDAYSVTAIGENAFKDCKGMTSLIIPNSITSIGNGAFSGCTGLTSIVIPDSVTKIGSGAFSGCSNLESVVISNSVTSIGNEAFSGCSKLESITFGSSVEKIGRCVFTGCNSLKNIVCKGLIPPKVDYDLLNYVLLTDNIVSDANLYMNATLTCPENAKWYRTLQPWCNFDLGNGGNGVMDTVFVYDTVYQIVSNKDTVYFADNNEKHKVTATSANTKMGIAYGSGMFAKGSQTEIVAIEKYGYHFTKWSDGNTENPRFVDVTKDGTFTAEFEVNNYWVLAEANEKVMGKVEGAAEYAYLSRTQLKATPNAGYQFKEWSDGETDNPREILVYSDTTFTAVFEEVAGTETSVAESAADAVNIYVAGNNIVVENATDEILVYNAMGALVGRGEACNVRTAITVNNPGLYIVKTGVTVKRVVVN